MLFGMAVPTSFYIFGNVFIIFTLCNRKEHLIKNNKLLMVGQSLILTTLSFPVINCSSIHCVLSDINLVFHLWRFSYGSTVIYGGEWWTPYTLWCPMPSQLPPGGLIHVPTSHVNTRLRVCSWDHRTYENQKVRIYIYIYIYVDLISKVFLYETP